MNDERKSATGPQNRIIEAIAFDLDGLMFNTEDLYDEVIDQVLQRRGNRFSKALKLRMMGLPGLLAIQVMIDEFQLTDDAQTLLTETHDGMKDLMPNRLQPMLGLNELLVAMESAGLRKSIATSSSPSFAKTALQISNLTDRFEFVLTTEDVERGKPHPDIYIESAVRHNVPVQNLLVLEDSLIGSKAAAASGAITVAVPGHHSVEQDFSHADFVLESLASRELLELIRVKAV